MKLVIPEVDIEVAASDLMVTDGADEDKREIYEKAVKLWLGICVEVITGNAVGFSTYDTALKAGWQKALTMAKEIDL